RRAGVTTTAVLEAEDVGDLRPVPRVDGGLHPSKVGPVREADGVVDPPLVRSTRAGGTPRVPAAHLFLVRAVRFLEVFPYAPVAEHGEQGRGVLRAERLEEQLTARRPRAGAHRGGSELRSVRGPTGVRRWAVKRGIGAAKQR